MLGGATNNLANDDSTSISTTIGISPQKRQVCKQHHLLLEHCLFSNFFQAGELQILAVFWKDFTENCRINNL